MFLILFYIICSFLIAVGLTEIYKFLIRHLFDKKLDDSILVVIPIKNHNEKIEHILRDTCLKFKWSDLFCKHKIFCIDCGMDNETKNICQSMAKQYDAIEILDIDKLNKILIRD